MLLSSLEKLGFLLKAGGAGGGNSLTVASSTIGLPLKISGNQNNMLFYLQSSLLFL